MFIGRKAELASLRARLQRVRDAGEGLLLSVRGRRQVGKSSIVEQFLLSEDVPSAFFSATSGASAQAELDAFAAVVAASSLEAAPLFSSARVGSWDGAFTLLAQATTRPSVVVIDEVPFLLHGDPALEGTLQRLWDRLLSRVPLLLILVGSDLSIMELLGAYDRPLYGRVREMVVEPFTVAETAEMLGLGAADAFDAQLVVGGFPRIASEWGEDHDALTFVRAQLTDSTSPLVVVGERALGAEFPPGLQAGEVLRAIGAGARTFAAIRERTALNEGSLTRTLRVLAERKRIIEVLRPLSTRRENRRLYVVSDAYLRFWLRFLGPNLPLILRGRGPLVAEQIARDWSVYRGQAVKPLVRAAVERLLPHPRLGDALHVGSYWSRDGRVEVDLVGAPEPLAPAPVRFVGSVKWREQAPFDHHDVHALVTQRAMIPGAEDAALVGVSRSGFSTGELDVAWELDDLLRAWSTEDVPARHEAPP